MSPIIMYSLSECFFYNSTVGSSSMREDETMPISPNSREQDFLLRLLFWVLLIMQQTLRIRDF